MHIDFQENVRALSEFNCFDNLNEITADADLEMIRKNEKHEMDLYGFLFFGVFMFEFLKKKSTDFQRNEWAFRKCIPFIRIFKTDPDAIFRR